MKRVPRILALLLAAVLILPLSGCGSSDGKTHLTKMHLNYLTF